MVFVEVKDVFYSLFKAASNQMITALFTFGWFVNILDVMIVIYSHFIMIIMWFLSTRASGTVYTAIDIATGQEVSRDQLYNNHTLYIYIYIYIDINIYTTVQKFGVT